MAYISAHGKRLVIAHRHVGIDVVTDGADDRRLDLHTALMPSRHGLEAAP